MSDSQMQTQRLLWTPEMCAQGWQAYLVHTGKLPMDHAARRPLEEAVAELLEVIRQATTCKRSVWLLLDGLHEENAVTEISRNARVWRPEMGMGLRPEGPPPKYWTGSDLLNQEYSANMPTLKHTVAWLDTDEAGAELACRLMTGRGALMQVLQQGEVEDLMRRWYAVLQPTIEEEGLAAYPLYVPLLSLASLERCSATTLDAWMGDADVYLRESAEDEGVVILSRSPLDKALSRCRLLRPALPSA